MIVSSPSSALVEHSPEMHVPLASAWHVFVLLAAVQIHLVQTGSLSIY
jgi:hypothetical protein